MIAQITNWKDLVSQFGYDTTEGLRGAKDISRDLRNEVKKNGATDHVTIDCTPKGEAIAIFVQVRIEDNQAFYEYTGTAN